MGGEETHFKKKLRHQKDLAEQDSQEKRPVSRGDVSVKVAPEEQNSPQEPTTRKIRAKGDIVHMEPNPMALQDDEGTAASPLSVEKFDESPEKVSTIETEIKEAVVDEALAQTDPESVPAVTDEEVAAAGIEPTEAEAVI